MKALLLFVLIALSVNIILALDPICNLPLTAGMCRAEFHKYGYDTSLRACREFVYGGCHGNQNNFNTLAECQAACN
ncbi:inducible serine protease inhibitor 2-like [Aphomia sociella]